MGDLRISHWCVNIIGLILFPRLKFFIIVYIIKVIKSKNSESRGAYYLAEERKTNSKFPRYYYT